MKEELQSKLVEILGSIQTAAGKAGDFAMVQLPEIAQQYVVYGRAIAVVKVLACAVVAVSAFLAYRWAWKNPSYSTYSWDEGKNKRSEGSCAALCATAMVGLFSLAVMVSQAIAGALVWFAPKVWLLKEIAGMLK